MRDKAKRSGEMRGKMWWGQKTIAEALGISLRSVSRYMAELKKAGLVTSKLCGSTSALYTISDVEFGVAATPPVAQGRPPVLITEPLRSEQASSRARGEIIELPPALLPTGHPNPIRIELNRRMRAAESRIKAARNPEAYERAILREELGRLTQSQPSKTTKTVFDVFVGSVPAEDPELEAFIREHESNLAARVALETRRKPPQPVAEWSRAILGTVNALAPRKALGRSP